MVKTSEKIVDLWEGVSIWKAHIDLFREQDKNARIMPSYKFNQLVKNIQKDKRLESLPLAVKIEAPSGLTEFSIISGHHRLRAARKAKVHEIFVMVIEEELSPDEITSKQIAHNALSGYDDVEILNELYHSMKDVEARIASGVREQELEYQLKDIKLDDVLFNLEYETLVMLFLPEQKKKFVDVIDMLEKDCEILVADMDQWEDFKKAILKVSGHENVRNISAIIYKMIEIIEEYYVKADKLTKAVIKKLANALKLGASYELACSYAGISYRAFRNWIIKAEALLESEEEVSKDEMQFVQFFQDIKKAESTGAVASLLEIQRAIDAGTWQAAAWKLERRFPEIYGRTKVDMKHSGDVENPVITGVNIIMPEEAKKSAVDED